MDMSFCMESRKEGGKEEGKTRSGWLSDGAILNMTPGYASYVTRLPSMTVTALVPEYRVVVRLIHLHSSEQSTQYMLRPSSFILFVCTA